MPTGTLTDLIYSLALGDVAKGVEIIVIGACGAVTSKNLDLAGLQLEIGPAATDFEFRPFPEELVLCQRYCHVWGGLAANEFFRGARLS
ncbi:MAG: hypothetical protein HY895_08695 [Deltaproteobacteria bacterium]|nr:hypothetical protein [Deltaproteobacteria bacterium]